MQEAVMGSKGRHNEKKPKQDKAKKAETKKAAKWNIGTQLPAC